MGNQLRSQYHKEQDVPASTPTLVSVSFEPRMARYLVGIDLGTTNSALAFVDTAKKARGGRPDVQTFPVPQLVAPGEVGERSLLPSFLYLPGPHDLPAGATALPWDAQA